MKFMLPFGLQPKVLHRYHYWKKHSRTNWLTKMSQFIVPGGLRKSCEITVWFCLLTQQTPCTCYADKAYCWAFWDTSDKMPALNLWFFDVSIWFQLSHRFCKSFSLLESPQLPFQNVSMSLNPFSSIPLFFSANKPSLCLNRSWVYHDMSYLQSPPPHPIKNGWCHLATCLFFTCQSRSNTMLLISLLNSPQSCTFLCVSSIRIAHVSCLGPCSSFWVGVFLTSISS